MQSLVLLLLAPLALANTVSYISPAFLLRRFMTRLRHEVLNEAGPTNGTLGFAHALPPSPSRSVSKGRQCLSVCHRAFDEQNETQSVSWTTPEHVSRVCRVYQGVRQCMDSCEFALVDYREFPLTQQLQFLAEPLDFVCVEKQQGGQRFHIPTVQCCKRRSPVWTR